MLGTPASTGASTEAEPTEVEGAWLGGATSVGNLPGMEGLATEPVAKGSPWPGRDLAWKNAELEVTGG